jgi:hypothetical protein
MSLTKVVSLQIPLPGNRAVVASHFSNLDQCMKTKVQAIVIAFMALLAATQARGDDAAIKRQLVGRWKTPGGTVMLKADGTMRQSGFPGPQKWDVRQGVFYDHRDSFTILSLTETSFEIQDQAHGHHTGIWTRIAAAER